MKQEFRCENCNGTDFDQSPFRNSFIICSNYYKLFQCRREYLKGDYQMFEEKCVFCGKNERVEGMDYCSKCEVPNAKYLKPDTGKKPEKCGNIRI